MNDLIKEIKIYNIDFSMEVHTLKVYNFKFISDIKCHCMMGLFPEIGRAWLTIDSEIYASVFVHLYI